MNSYRLKKERERTLFSCAVVSAAILLVFLISLIFNLLGFEDFNEYSGPVKITFGTPEGLDKLLESSEITKPAEPVETEPEPEKVAEPEAVKPEPVPVPEPDVKEPVETTEPVDTPEPVSDSTNSEVTESDSVSKPKPAPEPQPIVQKGTENGNSHETTFDSTSSKIGRRAYFPISQFMPLPEVIISTVFNKISGDITGMDEVDYNRNLFLRYYSKSNGSYLLNDTVPFQARPDLWGILEQAGYDLSRAEYKTKYNLNYVILSFVINSNTNGVNAISSVEIESTSGYKEIDDAVLYGFKQSTYSNSTNDKVRGRFKYSFK